MMICPRATCFQWPVSSFRISLDISNSSRLSTTKHHNSSRFPSHSRVLDKELSKSFSNVPIWRAISQTDLWKRSLFSPEIQKIPPGYSPFCCQRNSTARDVFPTPPRPQIAEWIQPFWLYFSCAAITSNSLSRPQKQRFRLGTWKIFAFVVLKLSFSSALTLASNWLCSIFKAPMSSVRRAWSSVIVDTVVFKSLCFSFNWEMSSLLTSTRLSNFANVLEISTMLLDKASCFSSRSFRSVSICFSMSVIRSWTLSTSSLVVWRAAVILLASSLLYCFIFATSFSKLVTSKLINFIKSLSTGQPMHRFKPVKNDPIVNKYCTFSFFIGAAAMNFQLDNMWNISNGTGKSSP